MKTAIFLSLLLLLGNVAVAQDSTSSSVYGLYTQFGATIPLSSAQHSVANLSFVLETRKKQVIAFRYYGQEYQAEGTNSRYVADKYIPNHLINEYNLSFGKVRHGLKRVSFYLSTGPSFVQYEMPYNLKEVSHPGNTWGGFFNTSIYEYDVRKYNLLGWSIRGDVAYIPWKHGGFSLGGVFNYNRKVPNGGLNLNMLVGKLPKGK